jgi:hypothetical protein
MDNGYTYIGRGIIAEPKNDNSKFVSIFLVSAFPFYEGNISNDDIVTTFTGTDAHGNSYSLDLQKQVTVKAEWAGSEHQLTCPSFEKGEEVDVYKQGQDEIYYVKSSGRGKEKRRKERVIFGFSASKTPREVEENKTSDNMYTMEVNTIDGFINLKTSMANDEKAGFTVQFNGKNGHFTITDSKGNIQQLDTEGDSYTVKMANGGFISLQKDYACVNHPKGLLFKSPKIKLDGDVIITGESTMGKDVKMSGNLTVPKKIKTDTPIDSPS